MSTKKTSKAVKKGKAPKAASAKTAAASRKAAPPNVKKQVDALRKLGGSVCDSNDKLQAVLTTLRDPKAPIEVRLAALQSVQVGSFSSPNFDACRPDYLAALRAVASDPDHELRQRSLGILAREHDAYAQQVLMDGLRDPSKALLSPEKALQLMSYDIHADSYALAREIVKKPSSPDAKLGALRLLAADAASAGVFEKLLRNKKESVEVRQLAASALQALAPDKLHKQAKAIVLDASETDQLKATSLTAITHFSDEKKVAKDKAFQKSVGDLKPAKSPALKRITKHFLAKYGD